MKRIQITMAIAGMTFLVLLGACTKEFITVQPEGQFLTENYYQNRDQAYAKDCQKRAGNQQLFNF